MSKKRWTVWVGGTEVTDYLVSKQVADQTRNEWIEKGNVRSDGVVSYFNAYYNMNK